ncbi:MAG: InlB B-repeat-containing protein, partial [Firmicutes bacterium]|nr:InlB B-repeat-containing protein [Bacillota bacterium]
MPIVRIAVISPLTVERSQRRGASYAAGIGGVSDSYKGNITINGGIVTAAGGISSAGIGGGCHGYIENIALNGGVITATGDSSHTYSTAGIGMGSYTNAGAGNGETNITIGSGVKKIVAIKCLDSADCIGKGDSTEIAVNTIFKDGDTIVEGDKKNSIFYDSETGKTRTIRTKALNHTVTVSGENITADKEYALAGETVTLTTSQSEAGYISVTVKDSDNNNIAITENSGVYSFIMPAKNVTIADGKTPIVYDITYNLNSGTLAENYNKNYTIESNDITLPIPTRIGYTFGGWYENSNFSGAPVTTIATGSHVNKTFYAKWTATAYTLTYANAVNGEDGVTNTNPATYTIESDNFNLVDPIRIGYTFEKWYSDAELTSPVSKTIAKGS